MGNLVTDAFVQQSLNQPTEDHWNDAAIAFINAGGMRATFGIGMYLLSYLSTTHQNQPDHREFTLVHLPSTRE